MTENNTMQRSVHFIGENASGAKQFESDWLQLS
jgi:hypothetical protein